MDAPNLHWTKAQGIKINEYLAKMLPSPMLALAERQQRFFGELLGHDRSPLEIALEKSLLALSLTTAMTLL